MFFQGLDKLFRLDAYTQLLDIRGGNDFGCPPHTFFAGHISFPAGVKIALLGQGHHCKACTHSTPGDEVIAECMRM